jgi:hypothetical protein
MEKNNKGELRRKYQSNGFFIKLKTKRSTERNKLEIGIER